MCVSIDGCLDLCEGEDLPSLSVQMRRQIGLGIGGSLVEAGEFNEILVPNHFMLHRTPHAGWG